MRGQLRTRLEELRQEFGNGQQRLAEIENQAAQLRQTLLRISGAIQVLEELLREERAGAEAETTAASSLALEEV
ncbi:MAG: hypothetical protein JOZ96_19935 [Acidobacteria bacterium]|nr:hypothetical protein [Acidobacteriota bacterium]